MNTLPPNMSGTTNEGMVFPTIDLEGLNWHQQSLADTYVDPSNQLKNIMNYATSEVSPYNPICWTKSGVIITTPLGGGPRSHKFFVDSESMPGGERPIILILPNDPSSHRVLITKHRSPIISISHMTLENNQFLLTLSEDGHLLLWESDRYSSNKYHVVHEITDGHIIKVSFIENKKQFYPQFMNQDFVGMEHTQWNTLKTTVLFTTLAATGKILILAYDMIRKCIYNSQSVKVNYTKFRSGSIGFNQNHILYAITECHPTTCIQIIKVAMKITMNPDGSPFIFIDQVPSRKLILKTLFCDKMVFAPDFSITHFEFLFSHNTVMFVVCSSSISEKLSFVQYYQLVDKEYIFNGDPFYRLELKKINFEISEQVPITALNITPLMIAFGFLDGRIKVFYLNNIKDPIINRIIEPKSRQNCDSYFDEESWGDAVQKKKLNSGAASVTEKLSTINMLNRAPLIGIAFSPNLMILALLTHEHCIELLPFYDKDASDALPHLRRMSSFSTLNLTNFTDILLSLRYLSSHKKIENQEDFVKSCCKGFSKEKILELAKSSSPSEKKLYNQIFKQRYKNVMLMYMVIGRTQDACLFQAKSILQFLSKNHKENPKLVRWASDIFMFLLNQVYDFIIYFLSHPNEQNNVSMMPNYHLLDLFDDPKLHQNYLTPWVGVAEKQVLKTTIQIYESIHQLKLPDNSRFKIKYWVKERPDLINKFRKNFKNFLAKRKKVNLYQLQLFPLLSEYLHLIPPSSINMSLDMYIKRLDNAFLEWLPHTRARSTLMSMENYEFFSSTKPHYECIQCGRTMLFPTRERTFITTCIFCGGSFKLNAGEKMAMGPF